MTWCPTSSPADCRRCSAVRAEWPGSTRTNQRLGTPTDLRREFALLEPAGLAGTLRRHGWKLALCSAIGLAAAIVLPLVRPASFQSEAKLLLRYTMDPTPSDQPGGARKIPLSLSPERAAFIDEQREILSSSRLAQQVAETYGAKRLLARAGGGEDPAQAASLIADGLRVWTTKNSSVIHLSFRHPDSTLLQGVLREVIDQYLRLLAADRNAPPETLAAVTRISNVSLVQSPSPPYVNSTPLLRLQATFIAAGLLIGLVWLLLIRLTASGLRLAR